MYSFLPCLFLLNRILFFDICLPQGFVFRADAVKYAAGARFCQEDIAHLVETEEMWGCAMRLHCFFVVVHLCLILKNLEYFTETEMTRILFLLQEIHLNTILLAQYRIERYPFPLGWNTYIKKSLPLISVRDTLLSELIFTSYEWFLAIHNSPFFVMQLTCTTIRERFATPGKKVVETLRMTCMMKEKMALRWVIVYIPIGIFTLQWSLW